MNIFVLHENPVIAARQQCDKHVVKMLLESYQMLGSAARRHGAKDSDMPLTQSGKPLVGGYHRHPCTVWAGDSRQNYLWLWKHAIALGYEFDLRYRKTHSCSLGLGRLLNLGPADGELTPFVQAMPETYRKPDAVAAYRAYYRYEKAKFARWEKGRPAPAWWE